MTIKKYNYLILILLLIMTILMSCGRNKMKTNEQVLAQQLKSAEQERKENQVTKPSFLDSLPPGIRFQEDRRIEKNNFPDIIDISNFQKTVRDFKLSELVEQITYIPLEELPDNAHHKPSEYSVTIAGNHILIQNLFSLYLYNRNGSFKDIICEGTGDRIDFLKKSADNNNSVKSTPSYVKGVLGNVWTIDNKLFYRYADNRAQKLLLMSYDMDSSHNDIPLPADQENSGITGKGKIQTTLGVEREERYVEYIPLSKDSYAGINSKIKSAVGGLLMTAFRLNGDTLSSFPDHETLNNYSHTLMRGNFPQFIYQYGNLATIRNAFNDTVYRIIPPNRLIPVYILKMGEYKIETQEGFTPGQDISSKLSIHEFFETQKHIYIRLIQGYDSPDNRKNKRVNIFYAIYEKQNKKLNLLPLNPTGYYNTIDGIQNFEAPMGIVNDIDGGCLFWPQNVSPKGEIYEVVTGDKLKKHIVSDEYINSKAPENKKNELRKLADKIREDQLVLIVYK